MEEVMALVFNEKFEMIAFQGPYLDYDTAWNIGILEHEGSMYCVPVDINDYFEGMENYLSDAMKQVYKEEN